MDLILKNDLLVVYTMFMGRRHCENVSLKNLENLIHHVFAENPFKVGKRDDVHFFVRQP